MNRNQGKFWTRRFGMEIGRSNSVTSSMTIGFSTDHYDQYRFANIGNKPGYEALVFPPELAGEEWEIIIIRYNDTQVPAAFMAKIEHLAKLIDASVYPFDETYCISPIYPKQEPD